MKIIPVLKHQISHIAILFLILLIPITCNQTERSMASLNSQPQDQQISQAVRSNIGSALGVPDINSIEISSEKGIVTISGTVDNLLAKERTTRIAKSTRGVRAVINDLKVPSTRTDKEIVADVQTALQYEPALAGEDVIVKVNEGRVTLGGSVDSWQELEIAETVVKGVKGVLSVENDINIHYNLERPDEEITADVRSSLDWDDRVDAELIDVTVENNVVTLTGSVGSAREKQLTKELAYVAGAKFVDASGLKVEAWKRNEMVRIEDEPVADHEIRQAVQDAYDLDPRLSPFEVDVEVVDGHVILAGTVNTVKAKQIAAETAKNTFGVVTVTNNIKVGSEQMITDDALLERIQDALFRDPYLSGDQVRVDVSDGTVELTGTAESYFMKWQVGNIVSKQEGVKAIENNITVKQEPLAYETDRYDWNPIVSDFDYTRAPADFTDVKILNEIRYKMSWSPWLNQRDIDVSVENGVATLTGEVDTWYQKYKATEKAYEAGADSVVNNIKIQLFPKIVERQTARKE